MELLHRIAPCIASLVLVSCGGDSPPRTQIGGTAYIFNLGTPIEGATIRVDELPELSATTAADGSWQLDVPTGAEITPYIERAGFQKMYLQTFRVGTEPLRNVFFQTPLDVQFHAMAQPLGHARGCAIVTTVSTKLVQGMTFAQFRDFFPHGVAGAVTNDLSQNGEVVSRPIYFNEAVLPDPTLKQTSIDGGVAYVNVPPGVYSISARHPSRSFAGIKVKCVEGRLINANPPWGLREL